MVIFGGLEVSSMSRFDVLGVLVAGSWLGLMFSPILLYHGDGS